MKIMIKYALSFAFLLAAIGLKADVIEGVNAKATDNLTCPATPLIVYSATAASDTKAKLLATSRTGATADFMWEKFNPTSQSYSVISAKSGVTELSIDNMGAGGYRLNLMNEAGLNDTTCYVWVIMDVPLNGITYENTCDRLKLVVDANTIYEFYDLSQSPAQKKYTSTNSTIEWSTSVDIYDGLEGVNATWKNETGITASPNITTIADPAPLVTATYTATVKNRFGNEAVATTASIPAIAVHPVMKISAKNGDSWSETKNLKGNALYRLRFDHSESKNADTYTWIGMDNYDYVQSRGKVLWSHTTTNRTEQVIPRYTYLGEEIDGYVPGRYPDSLIVKNTSTGCEARIGLSDYTGSSPFIEVAPSKFDASAMPNVFSPNGDGVNDLFCFVKGNEPVSIRTINFRIFNRSGRELYKYTGDVEGWAGWNGKMNGTGADCPAGVYYYIVSAWGWDNVSQPTTGSHYKGFLHLFRE